MSKFRLKNAPIVEVVIGAQFDGTPFDPNFIHSFYNEIENLYPLISHQLPLPSVFQQQEETKIVHNSSSNSRNFFISANQNKLIQLQSNKLLFNWRKNDSQDYPHFSIVLEEFIKIFKSINKKRNLNHLINQLEVTYLDHIYLEDFDIDSFNPNTIFNIIKYDKKIIDLENTIRFLNQELKASITVGIKSSYNNSNTSKKLWVVETICRGFRSDISIKAWLDMAHSELLTVFQEIFTDKAKNKWQIES